MKMNNYQVIRIKNKFFKEQLKYKIILIKFLILKDKFMKEN